MATPHRSEDLIVEARCVDAPEVHARLIDRLADALEAAEAARDAALAVIENVRGLVEMWEWIPERGDVLEALSSVPTDVLRERDAEKWQEGWDESGEGWNGEYLPPGKTAPNPYRDTEGAIS